VVADGGGPPEPPPPVRVLGCGGGADPPKVSFLFEEEPPEPPQPASATASTSSRRARRFTPRDVPHDGRGQTPAAYHRDMAATLRVGTCSWADETLTKVWYPKGVSSGEARLRYYAERFDVVEANSTYYRLPDQAMVARWAERTPEGFTMHVKAFGVMTRHPVKADVLPPDLREDVPVDEKGRVDRPSREWRAKVFERFHEALEPLRSAGKLGGILMQFPSYVVFRPQALEYLEWAQEQLRGDEMMVEFRHRSWLDEEHRAETLAFLEERGMTYVIVDAPRMDSPTVVPAVPARTSETVYLRLHGRNADTWNKRTGSAAERFDYLYSEEELAEWVEPLRELASEATSAYAMFNNNGRARLPSLDGDGEDVYAEAPTNAQMLRDLLERGGVPVAPAPAAAV
jgi:uncharacterized protein YecE (DUF72 family)